MKRIGIMGGTFNPIHNGHLAIAETARKQFALEKVLFMPSGIPYMKDQREVLSVGDRCKMTALAIADIPYFELSTLEAADAEQGKNTYTFETLQKLRDADPETDYYFILGADSLYAIERWKNPARIFQNCTILAAVRTEETSTDTRLQHSMTHEAASEQAKEDAVPAKSQNHLRQQVQYLRNKYNASVEILEFEGLDVSSTQIRKKVRRGESVRGLVPEAVISYFSDKHLYEKDS